MKTVLTIQSQVAGASVGNSVAVLALERLGVRAIALPTVVYGRRPDRGVPGGLALSAEQLVSMLNAVEAEGLLRQVDAVLSGYVAAPEQALIIRNAVQRVKHYNREAVYVCDPVMGDEGSLYVKAETAHAIQQTMLPVADVVAPNAFELARLTGKPVDTREAARAAIAALGKSVLVSSVPAGANLGLLFAGGGGDWWLETPRLPHPAKGAGDLLTALFVARRVRGEGAAVAIEGAAGAVHDVIVRAIAAGRDDLLVADAQDVLADPQTWPTAARLKD
jgi:pyridoxine kinase